MEVMDRTAPVPCAGDEETNGRSNTSVARLRLHSPVTNSELPLIANSIMVLRTNSPVLRE